MGEYNYMYWNGFAGVLFGDNWWKAVDNRIATYCAYNARASLSLLPDSTKQ